MSGEIKHDRCRFLGTAAMILAATHLGMFRSADAQSRKAEPADVPAAPADGLSPFRINVPEEALVDLRRRIAATRWPDRETVTDRSQGVQLARIQALVSYCLTPYAFKVQLQLSSGMAATRRPVGARVPAVGRSG
jgi:hypothetical protein